MLGTGNTQLSHNTTAWPLTLKPPLEYDFVVLWVSATTAFSQSLY